MVFVDKRLKNKVIKIKKNLYLLKELIVNRNKSIGFIVKMKWDVVKKVLVFWCIIFTWFVFVSCYYRLSIFYVKCVELEVFR